MDHKQIKGDHNNTHKFVMHPLKHIDDILRRAPKSTFSTIYFADEVMEDKNVFFRYLGDSYFHVSFFKIDEERVQRK